MILHKNLHRADGSPAAKSVFCEWWAVEASNLRPQQCECQFRGCSTCVSEESDVTGQAENAPREPLFTQILHRAPRLLQDETQTADQPRSSYGSA